MNRVYALVITALFAVLTACPGGGGGPESAPQVPPSKPLTFTHPIGQAGDSGDAGLTAEVPLISAATCQSLLQNKQPLPDQCAALFASFIDNLPPTPGAESCVYTYSKWDVCQQDGTQTRAVLTSLPANCTGKPVLIQHCTYVDPTLPIAPTVCISGGTTYSVGGTVSCNCSDGTKGSQACQKDGLFSQCGCENKPAPPPVCVAEQTTDCTSATGESGKQHCKPDGSGYGVCQTCSASTWADCKTAANETGQKQCKSDGSTYGTCETFCADPIGSVICDILKAMKDACPALSLTSLDATVEEATSPYIAIPSSKTKSISIVDGKAKLTLTNTPDKKDKFKSATFKTSGGKSPIVYEFAKLPSGAMWEGTHFFENTLITKKPVSESATFAITATDDCGQSALVSFEVYFPMLLNVVTPYTVKATAVSKIWVTYEAEYTDDKTQWWIQVFAKDGTSLFGTSWQYIYEEKLAPGPGDHGDIDYAFGYTLPTNYKLSDIANIKFNISDPGLGAGVNVKLQGIYLETADNSHYVYEAAPGHLHKSSGDKSSFTIPVDINLWKQVAPAAGPLNFK